MVEPGLDQAEQPLLLTMLWKSDQEEMVECAEGKRKGPRTEPRELALSKEQAEERGRRSREAASQRVCLSESVNE